MPLKKFAIEFDNTVRSFFPGEKVTGNVIIATNKNKKTEGVRLTFEGKALVNWKQTLNQATANVSDKDKSFKNKTVIFEDSEKYFEKKIPLVGNPNDSNIVTLNTGQHVYPFEFNLPLRLPSSFVGKHGMVLYQIEVVFKRPKKESYIISAPFTVNGILDLNSQPGASQSNSLNNYKNLCCLCCKSGPIGFKIEMARRGFVCGEWLSLQAEFVNRSRKKVKAINVKLIQTAKFHAKENMISHSDVICKVKGPGVERGESESWGDKIFQIPSIPPTRLATCLIIDVQYTLEIEMEIEGLAINLKGSLPIIIGTIPLRKTFDQLRSSRLPEPRHSIPAVAVGYVNINPGYVNLQRDIEDKEVPPPTTNLSLPQPQPSSSSSNSGYVNIPSKKVDPEQEQETIDEDSDHRGHMKMLPDNFEMNHRQSFVPSAPSFQNYPDLPPPSYLETIMSSSFVIVENESGAAATNPGFTDDTEGGGGGINPTTEHSRNGSFASFGSHSDNYRPRYVNYVNISN